MVEVFKSCALAYWGPAFVKHLWAEVPLLSDSWTAIQRTDCYTVRDWKTNPIMMKKSLRLQVFLLHSGFYPGRLRWKSKSGPSLSRTQIVPKPYFILLESQPKKRLNTLDFGLNLLLLGRNKSSMLRFRFYIYPPSWSGERVWCRIC